MQSCTESLRRDTFVPDPWDSKHENVILVALIVFQHCYNHLHLYMKGKFRSFYYKHLGLGACSVGFQNASVDRSCTCSLRHDTLFL